MDFEIYRGNCTPLINLELGLRPSAILRLVQTLSKDSFVYFDRYFSTLPLFAKFNELKIHGTGTIMANHITGLKLANADKMDHGACIEHVTKNSDCRMER